MSGCSNYGAVIAACGDPGGAGALVPVLERLVQIRGVETTIYAYGPAVEMLRAKGLSPRPPSEAPDHLSPRDVVFTATSGPNQVNLECSLLLRAKAARCASLVQMDFWSGYTNRFPRGPDGALSLPTRVCALDERMADELRQAGFPDDRIVITGHPGFDSLAREAAAFDREAARRVRAAHGVRPQERMVLFAAQPGYFAAHTDAFRLVVSALEQVAAEFDADIVLAVRPHPREPHPPVPRLDAARIRVVTDAPTSARAAALASDAVIGDTTMLLVESVLLRRPTISFRPGWATAADDHLPHFVPRAALRDNLLQAIREAFRPSAMPATLVTGVLADGFATERVLREVLRYVRCPYAANILDERP